MRLAPVVRSAFCYTGTSLACYVEGLNSSCFGGLLMHACTHLLLAHFWKGKGVPQGWLVGCELYISLNTISYVFM
jgi:hypothetical protein